jgi:hypothetical protein
MLRNWMTGRTVGRKETVAKIEDFLERKSVQLWMRLVDLQITFNCLKQPLLIALTLCEPPTEKCINVVLGHIAWVQTVTQIGGKESRSQRLARKSRGTHIRVVRSSSCLVAEL